VNPVDLGNGWGYYVYLEEDEVVIRRGLYSIPEEKEDDGVDEGSTDCDGTDCPYDDGGIDEGSGDVVIKNGGNVKQSYIGNMIHRILMGITIYFGIY
jgi:hypothetical protein